MSEPLDKPKAAIPAPQVVVVDPHNAPVQYVDWIVTGGHGPSAGTINLVLAAVDYSLRGDNDLPRAIVQSRLRLTVTTAAGLHRFLGDLLSGEPTTAPPPNKLN